MLTGRLIQMSGPQTEKARRLNWVLVRTAYTDFPNVVAEHDILGCAPLKGLWFPNANSAEIFVPCTCPKFHRPMFTRSKDIELTNTQTNRRRWKHPTLFATLRRRGWVMNDHSQQRWVDTLKYRDISSVSILSVSYRFGALDIGFFDISISWRWQLNYR